MTKKIPLVIMSSSGLGVDGVSMCLEKDGRLYENIHIISNSFLWDENGNAVGIRQPIIHSMNKDETLVQNFPAFQEVKNRNNVLLIGDNPEDIDMIKGFDYNNLITIGFLNEKVEENIPRYENAYDVIITNDAPMYFVNNLLKDIIK